MRVSLKTGSKLLFLTAVLRLLRLDLSGSRYVLMYLGPKTELGAVGASEGIPWAAPRGRDTHGSERCFLASASSRQRRTWTCSSFLVGW